MAERRYPSGIQTFENIRKDNLFYIDKTKYVYDLVSFSKYNFLSRPRRFGKSVLVSTLKSYFEGRKDLFEGLEISKLEKDWVKYPVIHLDFSGGDFSTFDTIYSTINECLLNCEKIYGCPDDKSKDYNVRLERLIRTAKQLTNQDVVVLIDEYDAPMLAHIDDEEKQAEVRAIMQNVYSPLKKCDPDLKFVFITGVTKYSQMSIFSKLNNLKTITMLPRFEGICGFTKDEVLTQMRPEIENLAQMLGKSYEQTIEAIRQKYDGYHFTIKMTDIYNPYSLINCLMDGMLNNYWFDSGTPSFLVKMLSKYNLNMFDFENKSYCVSDFDVPVEKITDPVPILYQSGYLTMKSYNPEYEDFTLGFPNEEVRIGFAHSLLKYGYGNVRSNPLNRAYIDFRRDDNVEKFINALKIFFAGFPFSLNNKNEKHYHAVLYTVLASFGADITAQPETALGKCDLILKMPKAIYIIELKYNHSAETALDQIEEKDYATAYKDDGRKVIKLGLSFDEEKRNIVEWKMVEA